MVCNCSSSKYKLSKNKGLCDIINLCDKNEVGRKQCDYQRAQCLETDIIALKYKHWIRESVWVYVT